MAWPYQLADRTKPSSLAFDDAGRVLVTAWRQDADGHAANELMLALTPDGQLVSPTSAAMAGIADAVTHAGPRDQRDRPA